MTLDPRFLQILREVAELDRTFQIEPEQDLKHDLGIDSLKLIDIVLAVERSFGAELSEDALSQLQTVGSLWEEVAKSLSKESS